MDREVGKVGRHLRPQLLALCLKLTPTTLVQPDDSTSRAWKEVVGGADHRERSLATRDALNCVIALRHLECWMIARADVERSARL